MAEYKVRVWFELERTYTVSADDEQEAREQAERAVLEEFPDADVTGSKDLCWPVLEEFPDADVRGSTAKEVAVK